MFNKYLRTCSLADLSYGLLTGHFMSVSHEEGSRTIWTDYRILSVQIIDYGKQIAVIKVRNRFSDFPNSEPATEFFKWQFDQHVDGTVQNIIKTAPFSP